MREEREPLLKQTTSSNCHINCMEVQIDKVQEIADRKARRAILLACTLCVLFMIAEFVAGYIANSVAVFSDALHMLSDIAGMLLSLFAMGISKRPASQRWSFGFRRMEIIGSLCSVFIIWIMAGILLSQAIPRLFRPVMVDGLIMIYVAVSGIAMNMLVAGTLYLGGGTHGHSHGSKTDGHGHGHGHNDHGHNHGDNHGDEHGHGHGDNHGHGHKSNNHGHGHKSNNHGHGHESNDNHKSHGHGHGHDSPKHKSHGHAHGRHSDGDEEENLEASHHDKKDNINIRAAFVHAVGDILQNIGVLIAAVLIWWDPVKYKLADPIATIVFALMTVYITKNILRDASVVLLDLSPTQVDGELLKEKLSKIRNVKNVHDLHIWHISYNELALSAHVEIHNPHTSDNTHCSDRVLSKAQDICKSFGIGHSTIQIESNCGHTTEHTTEIPQMKGEPANGHLISSYQTS